MKTVRMQIGIPSLYNFNGEERDRALNELRHEIAGHFHACGIYEGQLEEGRVDHYGNGPVVICDDKSAMRLVMAIGIHEHGKLGVKKIEELFDTEDTSYDRMLEKLELAAARLTEAAAAVDLAVDGRVLGADKYNAQVNTHLTGNTLSSYNSLRLLEDCCTDHLQEALDNGWRIVACCPQEARRPDYILGRYDPHHNPEIKNGAAR